MTVIPPLVWEQESGRIKTWTQSDEHSVSEIVAALRARIADLAHDLLGEPNRALSTRQQLRYGSKGSLAIEIDGPQRGDWFDHEQNVGGDGLKLICTQRGLANGAALDWARDWLGLPPWGGHRRADTCLGARSNGDASKAPGRSTADDDGRPAERLAPEADRAGKVDGIIGKCIDLTGTAGELYLNGRAINACPWPHSLRYHPNAHDRYGALVALATEADGTVAAVQQIYVTSDGRKAPLAIRKRTNKAREEWAKVSAVRLPGRSPLVLCEGVENALSVWQATGQETWACLGIANIGKAPVPVGEPVIIARDGDPPGSKADNQLARAAQALVQRGHVVAIATPPEGEDANDVLVEEGDEAVSALIATAEPITAEREKKQLFIGSDVEIAAVFAKT